MSNISMTWENQSYFRVMVQLNVQKLLIMLLISATLGISDASKAQEYKGLIGGGIGYSTNLQEMKTVGANLVGELPIKRGSSFYANFHWSIGMVSGGTYHIQSNLASVATFVAMTEDDQNAYWAGQAAGLLMIIPTGFTYYALDSLPSRFGFYLNPLNGEYYEYSDNEDVLAYAPEIGMKYMHQLYKKTFLYFSGGCAYTMAIDAGSSDIQPNDYQDGLLWKFTAGIVFFGTSDKKQGTSKPKN